MTSVFLGNSVNCYLGKSFISKGIVRYGFRSESDGELLTSNTDFDDIVNGVIDVSQQCTLSDSSLSRITIDFKSFGNDQFTPYWHWVLVPASVSDYVWCDWVGNLGTPKLLSTKIRVSDPETVTVDGVACKLYRLLYDTAGTWTFSVNEII